MKKKKTAYISAAVLFLIVGTLMVYAYFRATNSRTNTVKVGGNTISINEDGKSLPDTDSFPQTRTTVYDKPVKIDNTGDVACYVRVRLDFSDDTVKSLTKFSVDGTNFVSVANGYEDYLEKLGSDWDYVGGYFYYTKSLESGESTPYLLKKVRTDYGTAETQAYDIYVYAESVQAVSSSGTDEGYAKAWNEFLGDTVFITSDSES